LQIRLAGVVVREKFLELSDCHLPRELSLCHNGGSFV
jgi:hypothetical protein